MNPSRSAAAACGACPAKLRGTLAPALQYVNVRELPCIDQRAKSKLDV